MFKMMHAIVIASLGMILLVGVCFGAGNSYYVSPTGSDSSPGTLASPWKTLAKAVSSVSSGDTVYLRAGTWNEKLSFVGKAYTTWVTFQNYQNETVTIDGTGISLSKDDAEGLVWIGNQWENGSSYIRIRGLHVTNSSLHAISITRSHHIEILYNFTHTSQRSGVMVYDSHDVLLDHNDIQKACKEAEIPGRTADEPISVANGSYNVEVSYNHFHNPAFIGDGAYGGEGINVKGGDPGQVTHDVTVHHNIVDQARTDLQPSTRLCYATDGWQAGLYNVYFYGNIARNCKHGLVPESEQGGTVHDVWFYNNIVYNISGSGIYMPNWELNNSSLKQNIYLVNNTIYNCAYGARFQTTAIDNIFFRNNIIANCTRGVVIESGVPSEKIAQDHNLTSGDPRFVNASGGNFHLESDSPAVDAGIAVARVTGDFDGIVRPQGTGYDIGAYEYFGVGGGVPAAPSNLSLAQ
jgi:hypothetical protein